MKSAFKSFQIFLLLCGVFAADEVSVSVLVGDSVTLRVTEAQEAEKLRWKIQGEKTFIATIDRETNEATVDGNTEKRFSGRLDLNSTTGCLTITNLKTTDSRVYELQMKIGRETKDKIFNVTVRGGMKTESVKEGERFTLHTGLIEIKGYDLISWTTEGGHVMFEINRKTNLFEISSAGGKFEGRLEPERQSGSLSIRNSKTTDTGVYHLFMSSSTHSLQRTVRVTVTVSGFPSAAIAGIVVAFVLLIPAAAVAGFCYNQRKHHHSVANPVQETGCL